VKKYSLLILFLAGVLIIISACRDEPKDQEFVLPDSNLKYIDHIRPMFVAKCASYNGCHSVTDQAGGLDLTNYYAIINHYIDVSIPLVINGDGENSALYRILLAAYLDNPRMPLDGPYLNTNNSNGVKIWIDEGLN
jgi:hypothetical protein